MKGRRKRTMKIKKYVNKIKNTVYERDRKKKEKERR